MIIEKFLRLGNFGKENNLSELLYVSTEEYLIKTLMETQCVTLLYEFKLRNLIQNKKSLRYEDS